MFIGRTDVEAETAILWPSDGKNWLIWKDPDAGKDWGKEEKGTTEDEIDWWHHWLNGHRFGWTPGAGDGQEGLACCSSWGCRVRHDWVTELNWTEHGSLSKLSVNNYDKDKGHLNSSERNIFSWICLKSFKGKYRIWGIQIGWAIQIINYMRTRTVIVLYTNISLSQKIVWQLEVH